jgi:hypothetical protein
MNSGGSSSFWFQQDETPGWQTEIDVFEIGGKAKGFEYKDNLTVHVFRTPRKKEHWQVGGAWVAPWRLADDYHVYELDWDKGEITSYVDEDFPLGEDCPFCPFWAGKQGSNRRD